LQIIAPLFTGPLLSYQSHTAHLGKIKNSQGQILDEVLVLVFLGNKSFTGEDTVEIHCHGGSIVTRKILEEVLQSGARAALPGEFSFKAFMNGKIDLAQAEAIQEVISARNEISYEIAKEQLQGHLSKKIHHFQKELIDIAAILEAWVDFPEEGLEFASKEELILSLETILENMKALSLTFHEGKIIKEGLSLCLAGPPNAGKSSLMNALLGKDRAIVTPIPGTTRDLLEDDLSLGGLHFRILDTAGIRQTDEMIEQEGIRRSKQAMERADLILLIVDASAEIAPETLTLLHSSPPQKTILVWNKMDLSDAHISSHPVEHHVQISAKTGAGLDELKQTIHRVIWKKGPPSKEEVIITNLRHKQALDNAIQSCEHLIEGLNSDISPEFLAADIRSTLFELATIVGGNITEDVLTAIFSKFCIGK
jgi:tRNA modification GTPase